MILIEFLFAPTVPSEPNPQKTRCTVIGDLFLTGRGAVECELRVTGRAPWQVLAGAAAAAAGQKDGLRGLLRYQAAPYDVSYLVASWAAAPDAADVLAG